VALDGVSFVVATGEILGVLGESGSGKSTLAAAALRLLPTNGNVMGGAIEFEGLDLLHANLREVQKLRGFRIALIFQEPTLALHPTIRVGEQVSEVIAAHNNLTGRAVREKTRRILAAIFPVEAERIANSFPHELSGGQRARVLIAQAISCGPSLIIGDEPTASLDSETQREILAIFAEIRQKFQLSLIWITHNPALLACFADRVLVLYAGKVVEVGPTESVLSQPQHPYTRALLRGMPPVLQDRPAIRKTWLPVIKGELLSSAFSTKGCVFETRCEERLEVCSQLEPVTVRLNSRHEVSCFKHGK
jgi:peptide/nickel transport system ATP-binding protein